MSEHAPATAMEDTTPAPYSSARLAMAAEFKRQPGRAPIDPRREGSAMEGTLLARPLAAPVGTTRQALADAMEKPPTTDMKPSIQEALANRDEVLTAQYRAIDATPAAEVEICQAITLLESVGYSVRRRRGVR